MTTLSTQLAALLARRGMDYIDEFDTFMTTLTAAQNGVGAGLVGTSTTSATIGAGAQSLTVQADKNFAAGQYVVAYQTSNTANFMIGVATAYNGDTGVLAFTVASGDTGGSGTITDWTVAVSGRRGATGAAGGLTGGTLTGNIDGDAAFTITNLPAPSGDTDAARKSYVDAAADDAALFSRMLTRFGG